MKNKKIFITGGAGFLGRNIIEKYYNDNSITVLVEMNLNIIIYPKLILMLISL